MNSFFVPYAGRKPAALDINGHRLVILSTNPETFKNNLDALGADKVKKVTTGGTQEEQAVFFNRLAAASDAGVVIAPGDVEVEDVIENLRVQLPWLH